jgi:hypothetical protein
VARRLGALGFLADAALASHPGGDVLATPNPEGGWGQCGANAVASRMPVQRAAGCGGCQRSGPTGGAA